MATKQHATKTATTQESQKQAATSSPASPKPQVERSVASRPAKAPKKLRPRPSSGLDAAHAVLRQRSKPMTVRDITNAIFEQKLWTTAGKTPRATIAAAIIRAIKDKGNESRFIKTGRGLFTARGAKAAKGSSKVADTTPKSESGRPKHTSPVTK